MALFLRRADGLITWSSGGHVKGLTPLQWATYENLGAKLAGYSIDAASFAAIMAVEGVADGEEADVLAAVNAIAAEHWPATTTPPA